MRGDVTIKILGIESTQALNASYRNQLGLNQSPAPALLYVAGGERLVAPGSMNGALVSVHNPQTNRPEWVVQQRTSMTNCCAGKWKGGALFELVRQEDSSTIKRPAPDDIWTANENGIPEFWGVNNNNSVVRWIQGKAPPSRCSKLALNEEGDSPVEFIPLSKRID
ncbi:MAG: hypothetical protein R2911_22270 [Caldilineaceae bacterium]